MSAIRVEPLTLWEPSFADQLCEHALKEIGQVPDVALAIERMNAAWQIWFDDELVCLIGVYKSKGLLGPKPEVWFLCGKAPLTKAKLKALREMRFNLFDLFPQVQARIPPNFRRGCRFAEFFGFNLVAENDRFRTYEVR